MNQILGLFPEPLRGIIGGILKSISEVWGQVWWIALPLITFFIFWEFWLTYIRFKFIVAIKWDILEIKVPKNVLKNPKAMEQIFAAAHAPYSYGLRPAEIYWEGKVEYWMSFEMVGRAGEMHFYLRCPKQFRNLMESAIYAQYPEAEIIEAEDYVRQMARTLPNKTYDLYGADLILKNPDCYPIRTYPKFEEAVEEQRVDPIAIISEAMSKLKSDEQMWIQILTRPTGDDWKKKGEALVKKLTGLEPEAKKGIFEEFVDSITETLGEFGDTLVDSVREIFSGPIPTIEAKKKNEKEKNPYGRMLLLTPGERDVVEAIENKIAKLGFQTTIRFIYIDSRNAFSRDNVASVMGAFRQFSTQNLNLFRPDKLTMTAGIHGFFKGLRLNYRKRVIHEKYRDLGFNPHKPVLNIEELATIYHFPIVGVSAPMLQRIESRRGGPPPTLPITE